MVLFLVLVWSLTAPVPIITKSTLDNLLNIGVCESLKFVRTFPVFQKPTIKASNIILSMHHLTTNMIKYVIVKDINADIVLLLSNKLKKHPCKQTFTSPTLDNAFSYESAEYLIGRNTSHTTGTCTASLRCALAHGLSENQKP